MVDENNKEAHKSVKSPDNYLLVWFSKAHCIMSLYKRRKSSGLEKQFLSQLVPRRHRKDTTITKE